MQLFLKEQDKCKSKRGQTRGEVRFLLTRGGSIFDDKGRLSGFVYEISVKTLMCFLMTEL